MSKNKTTIAIALFLTLTIAVTVVALPMVNASTPPRDWPVFAYVLASPNPVGVGQPVLTLMFIDKIHPTAEGMYGGRFHGYTVEITKPDNSKETLGPFSANQISHAYTTFTPDQVGTYTLVFRFPETLIVDENPPPPGVFRRGLGVIRPELVNDTYKAATSEPFYLTVQQDPVPSWQDPPLPTDYWTSPINALNRNWWSIGGNWLGGAQSGIGVLMPYTTGPESAHILWTKPFWEGGIAGGEAGGYTYLSSAGRDNESPIIINGRIYLRDRGSTSETYGWSCIDLYTGETLWYNNDIAYPSFGQVLRHESFSQRMAKSYLWSISGSNWTAIDAYSGKKVLTIINAQATGTAGYSSWDGAILRYRIVGSGANKRLTVWNTSEVLMPAIEVEPARPGSGFAQAGQVSAGVFDGLKGFSVNVSIPNVAGSIFEAVEDKWVIGGVAGKQNQTHVELGHIWTLNLKKGQEGRLISNVTFTPPKQTMDNTEYYAYGTGAGPGVGRMHGPFVYSEYGVFLFYEGVSRRWWGFSLETGQQIWGPTEPQGAMMSYSAGEPHVAYGILYTSPQFNEYGGEINAYNITTGEKIWVYYPGAPGMETAMNNQPININVIADGKIYAVSKGEHIPVMPLRRDAVITALDAFTGEVLWKLAYYPRNAMALSRGYLVAQSSYDDQMYVIGKGPSATTVTASPKTSVYGSEVLIEGTVVDVSPGTEQHLVSARFPNGVPAISDEDQQAWMEYVYMQQPAPFNVKGVEVSLDALDPNGNFVHIGTVTSDAAGAFKKMFTPEVPGEYTVIATFAGSKSYGSSYAQTAIGVSEAPEASPEPTPAPAPLTDLYVTGFGIGIIIAIVAIGLLVILMLRKR